MAQSFLVIGALSALSTIPAQAQYAEPIMAPNDLANRLNQQGQQTPAPPPPGTDGTAPRLIEGDTGTSPTASTGQADQTAGTNFPVGQGQTASLVRIFVDDTQKGRGLRMVQEINPATLSQQTLGKVQAALGQNLNSGEAITDVTVTKDQMAQLNEALAPYPQADMEGNRKKINSDTPGEGYPKQTNKYEFGGPLPTVKTFSRYLVLLGVVASTIFMAIAAAKVTMGHRNSGENVVQAIAGLMLLLMSFTIWKIVQMNTMGMNSNDPPDVLQKSGGTGAAQLNQTNLPIMPTAPTTGPARSGIPVVPLSGGQ